MTKVSLRRFFVQKIDEKQAHLVITGTEARHISRVLRMGPGDRIILFDGQGARFQAVIESAQKNEVRAALEKTLPPPSPSPLEITLCQSLLKSRSMDYMIQKASELGVDRILPFFSQRTAVKVPAQSLANKVRHWRQIALSAAKQCDRTKPAEIGKPVSLPELLVRLQKEHALKIILWEQEERADLRDLLKTSRNAGKVAAIVGPEGGFGFEEIARARLSGFKPIFLGPRILRAETAAIVLVALLQYEWGDLSLQGQT